MSIIGTFPSTLQNGTPEDATQVMALLAYIQSQTNGNACPATATSAILKGNGAGGTAAAAAGTDFQAAVTAILGASGSVKIPSAAGPLLVNWGALTSSASADVNTIFTTAFSAVPYAVTLTAVNAGGGSSNASVSIGAISASSFNTGAYISSTGSRVVTAVYYIAVGPA